MPSSRPEDACSVEDGPFFREGATGAPFCLLHVPPSNTPVRGGILAVHAFAEEMNKTRAAVGDGARALASAGFVVLQVDLEGCGDSAGSFGDATWDGWLADLADAWQWLGERTDAPRWLWGTRLGALLADRFAADCAPSPAGLLLWQPVAHGAQHLNQFLRLHTVRGMLQQRGAANDRIADGSVHRSADGSAAAADPSAALPATPREALVAGQAVEIAGYRLGPALALSIDAAQMGRHERAVPRIRWLQVGAEAAQPLTPVLEKLVQRWRTLGSDVSIATVPGAPFWQTLETERCPALVEATVESMCR